MLERARALLTRVVPSRRDVPALYVLADVYDELATVAPKARRRASASDAISDYRVQAFKTRQRIPHPSKVGPSGFLVRAAL